MGPNSGKLKAILEDQIRRTMENVSSRTTKGVARKVRGGFLTMTFLHETFSSPQVLSDALRDDFPQMDNITLRDLESVVRRTGPKLYAILVLIDESTRINDLMFKKKMNDHALFPTKPPRCYLLETELEQIPGLLDIAKQFYEKQWSIAPMLLKDHQEFPCREFVFPFESAQKRIQDTSHSWGDIYHVKIAEGCLEAPAKLEPEYNLKVGVVYKAIKPDTKPMDTLKREVKTLQSRRHRNIIRLLSSFETGRVNLLNETDDLMLLYMVFPYADGDMSGWMKDGPEYNGPDEEFRKYMYGTMRDLVSALAYIHRQIGDHHAHHHDIKPANILRFDVKDGNHIWKICDFGNANLKGPGKESGTQIIQSTHNYVPPEYYFAKEGEKHGRAYDVWSLGCVLLELATITTFRWSEKGLTEFVNLRRENTVYAYDSPDPRYKEGDISFFNNMGVVRRWIDYLRGRRTEDRTFVGVLNLIEEMLDEQRDERVYAWEIEIDLYEILNHPKREELKGTLKDLLWYYKPSENRRNPLQRAEEKRKPDWWQKMLRGHALVDDSYEPDERLDERVGSTGQSFSTLELVTRFNGCASYGQDNMIDTIKKHFKSSRSVGLCGFWGIGKSFLAYLYASSTRKTMCKDTKYHIFWVTAENFDTFRFGYQNIAKAIRLTGNSAWEKVQLWLEDENNGKWLMVVDGLDSNEVCQLIGSHLPRKNGKLLFTSRNKLLLCDGSIPVPVYNFLQVTPLQPEFSRCLIRGLVDMDIKNSETDMDHLAEQLHSPLLIKKAAEYMLINELSIEELLENLKRGMVDVIKKWYQPPKNRSGITDRTSFPEIFMNSSPKGPVLRLLVCLACLNYDSLEKRLVLKYASQNQAEMSDLIATLLNCSLIRKVTSEHEGVQEVVYAMPRLVREGVIAWIRENRNEQDLIRHCDKALRMLWRLYGDLRNSKKFKEEASKIRRPLDGLKKTLFMLHFDRFLEYTSHPSAKKEISKTRMSIFSSEAAMSIEAFSDVYMNERRYEDAIRVLEFADHLHTGEARFRIGFMLAKAYLKTGRKDPTELEKLLERLRDQAMRIPNDVNRYELSLYLVRLYRDRNCLNDIQRAQTQFSKYLNDLKFQIKDGKPTLPESLPQPNHLKKHLRKYSIKVQVEDARLNLEDARLNYLRGDLRMARSKLEKAKTGLEDAIKAITEWFPYDDEWIMDVDEVKVVVLCDIQTYEALKEAEDKLEVNLVKWKEKDRKHRILETQRLLATVRTKGPLCKVRAALQSLKKIIDEHENIHGDEHETTKKCQALLQQAKVRERFLVRRHRIAQVAITSMTFMMCLIYWYRCLHRVTFLHEPVCCFTIGLKSSQSGATT